MRSLGVELELLDRDALAKRFPRLHWPQGEAVEGLLELRGGYVDDPEAAARDAARAAERKGARFLLGTPVAEVLTRWNGGRLEIHGVRTKAGERLEAPVAINCAGPHSGWTNLLARSPLPLTTAPLRQVVLDGTAPADDLARLPVIADLLSGFYLRPDPDRLRIGALLPREENDWLPDADEVPEAEPAIVAARLEAARRRLPRLAPGACRGIVGVYDVTVQDWYPIVDRTDTLGYFVAIGTSGAWFKAGPVIGMLAAELVRATLAGRDTDQEPLEVALPRSGYRFPMRVFSRHRRPVDLAWGGGVLG
jgi:sarcosine oxidase subunit beta